MASVTKTSAARRETAPTTTAAVMAVDVAYAGSLLDTLGLKALSDRTT